MGMMSRRKGADGEREAAMKLNEVLGTRFHRGRQYRGGPESPDLAGDVPELHVEVKRTERLRIWEAMQQARSDAGADQVPVVMHRANHKPWLVIIEAEMLIQLLDVVDEARAKLDGGEEEQIPGERIVQAPSRDNYGGPRKETKVTKHAGGAGGPASSGYAEICRGDSANAESEGTS